MFRKVVFISLLLLASCSVPSREEILIGMPQLLEVEVGYARVMDLLRIVGTRFSEDDARKAREHYDLYHVFHYTAMTDLAHGDKESFARNLDRASMEVAALEKLLTRLLAS